MRPLVKATALPICYGKSPYEDRMKNILDALNGNGGLKAGLGNMGDTLKNTLQNVGAGSPGGIGGLLGSAALGGLLGALFTGKSAQKIAKGALVVGGTAAAGALAWNFYKKWAQGGQADGANAAPAAESPASHAQGALPPAENTALLLLEAMVFAARADGHIDEEEKSRIQDTAASLFPGQSMTGLLDGLMNRPIDPAALAARVRDPEEGRDLYRLSRAVVNVDNFMERSYLDGLARALNIGADEQARLEKETEAAVQNAV